MYEQAEVELKRIIELVEMCPDQYRQKAFEILLQGYVTSVSSPISPTSTKGNKAESGKIGQQKELSHDIPTDVNSRISSMAKRRSIQPDQLAILFDFSSEPFTFAPINVTGESKKDRTRKVALLVAARSFLTTGRWIADWAEIKAMSTHQNCYDHANFAQALKEGKGGIFKSVNSGSSVELSASGEESAEILLAELSQANVT
jgi:hypothetical protein